MNKIKGKASVYLFVLIALVFFSLNVAAVWCSANPDKLIHKPDITDGLLTELGYSNNWSESPSIVVYEDVPYIAYEGQRSGTSSTQIFFTYWNGTEWQEPIKVSGQEDGDLETHNPIMVINIQTGEMHMVWSAEGASKLKIFYSRSNGFGDPWSVPISLDELNVNTKDHTKFPFIGLDSEGFAHVIFFYEQGGTREVYYTTNSNGSWSVPEKLGDSAQETGTGRINPIYITVDRKTVPNVPTKPISFSSFESVEKGTIKFGVGPTDPCRFAACGNSSCESSCGETAINCCGDCGNCLPDTIHVVWKNKADEKLVHKQKDIINGAAWSAMDYVDSGKSSHPFSVADNYAGLHITYESESIASNTEIYYKMLESGSWKTKPVGGSPNISNTPDHSLHSSIAVDADAMPKIVWAERMPAPTNKNKIFYKQWNPDTKLWEVLGSNPIWIDADESDIHNAMYPSIRLDFEGNPYVAWEQKLVSSGRGQIWMVYWSDDCSVRPGPNKPPKAKCKVIPTEGDIKTQFKFDSRYSNDDHTSLNELEVRWDWDALNGVTYDTEWTTKKIAYHSFNNAGPYTVTLQVKDEEGKAKTSTCEIDVDYGDVLFLFGVEAEPISVEPGETINFTAFVLNRIDEKVHATLTFKITDEEGNVVHTFESIDKVIPKNTPGNVVEPVKEFTQTYTANLPEYKIYYIYADVIVDPLDPLYAEHPEADKYLYNNTERTLFTMTRVRPVNLQETSVIGIAAVIITVAYVLRNRKKKLS